MEGGGDCRRTARSPVKREYPKEEGRWEPAPGGESTPTPPTHRFQNAKGGHARFEGGAQATVRARSRLLGCYCATAECWT